MDFLNSVLSFLAHLLLAAALVGAFLAAYVRTTPHREIELIRKGNVAAAIGLMGATIAFAMVLARAITVSSGLGETLVWGLIGLVVQVAGHWMLSFLMPRLYTAIEEGDTAAGVMKAGVAITLGLVNAASMTP
jgi:putative membrane protein